MRAIRIWLLEYKERRLLLEKKHCENQARAYLQYMTELQARLDKVQRTIVSLSKPTDLINGPTCGYQVTRGEYPK